MFKYKCILYYHISNVYIIIMPFPLYYHISANVYIIIVISPLVYFHSTFVCPTEIIAFSDRAEEFRAIGCEVLACSTDSVYSHLAWLVVAHYISSCLSLQWLQ